MRAAFYLDQWHTVRGAGDPEKVRSLAQRVAAHFLERYFYSDEYNAEHIELLCRMCTEFADDALNQVCTRVLFGTVIERLCDDFEELQTETYNRLICQITGFLRRHPGGEVLDRRLAELGLVSDESMYQRIETVRLSPDIPIPALIKPKKVLVLSRITIGADVAITTVICQRVARRYPQAEIIVLGNDKLQQVLARGSGVRVREQRYARHGSLLQRFLAWLFLLEDVEQEIAGLASHEYLLLDPDSRLTQLGVLPLVPDLNYRFFNSRGKTDYPVRASISQLTNMWLDTLLGADRFAYPQVWLETADQAKATAFVRRSNRQRHLITLNFGVGGNHRKQVPDPFEARLVIALLQQPDTRLLLDMGFGPEEIERSTAILAAAARAGFKVGQTTFAELDRLEQAHDLLGIHCCVGEVAALIRESQEFIGYDSACQHIAAAQGIRTFTVFAGTNNPRFIRRWHACGPNTSEILFVDTLSRDTLLDTDELVARLLDLRSS